jgi:murein DD-endopeptidase MepM/ murein hydrolase activator NlpD
MRKVNVEAKKERHKKLFEGQYHTFVGKIWFHTRRLLKKVWQTLKPSRRGLSEFMHPLDHLPAPRRLYAQLSIWSIGLLMLTSVNVSYSSYYGEGVNNDYEYLALEVSDNTILDDEGYIIKNMPLEGEAVYDQNRTEIVEHEVQSGETLSVIAYRYGVEVSSIKYANDALTNSDYLKIGQVIDIPPADGLYVTVEEGDSLVSIVEDYEGDLDATLEWNGLSEDGSLVADTELFIIDGEPQTVYVAVSPTYTTTTSTTTSYTPEVTHYDVAASAEGWIRPTSGIITQGYSSWHYAYDVADSSKPPILAAASGTVIKASSGTWGGGYGNHIIIDHGNGYQTLYAHAEVLYVNVGDYVDQGDVIAKMGATGRVYGVTGIHLHFELSYYGTKLSPSVMGVW